MSKHTPGPWKVAAIPGAVIAVDNTTIAKVFYGERSVCDANARLIAAAPELLEALKGLESRHEPGVFCDHAAAPCDRCDAARVAIAKAEGGT